MRAMIVRATYNAARNATAHRRHGRDARLLVVPRGTQVAFEIPPILQSTV